MNTDTHTYYELEIVERSFPLGDPRSVISDFLFSMGFTSSKRVLASRVKKALKHYPIDQLEIKMYTGTPNDKMANYRGNINPVNLNI